VPSVLVTGTNRGIGLEFVRQYAADGWRVIACCRKPGEAAALKKIAGDVTIEALDLADDAQVAALAERLKGKAIDLLINNAGTYGPRSGSDTTAWLDVFRVNTIAPFHLAEALAPHVARSELKMIVSLTSRMGSVGETTGSDAAVYRSSKAGLNMVMKCLSNGLKGQGITVAVFHPGWVQTDMGGKGAPLAIPDSVGSLRKSIAKLTAADNGCFFNYDGKPIPW
jgi:NAD(P)-dependent dehydrogenase (short-subunit alcohol dehydrogenase family)